MRSHNQTGDFTFRVALLRALRFGGIFALPGAAVLGAAFAGVDWYGNPGGIFRTEAGTNWNFVYDTWVSWFIPSILPILLYATLFHLLLTLAIRYIRSRMTG